MALDAGLAQIDFTGGLDKKTDGKLVLPGKLTTLENGVFLDSNTVSKGGGYSVLGATGLTGTTALAAAQGTALLQVSTLGLAKAYAQSADAWNSVATEFLLSTIRKKQVVRNAYTQSNVDAAKSGNYSLWAWEDTRGGLRYCLVDEQSGNVHTPDALLASAGEMPRVVACNSKLCVLWLDPAAGKVWMRVLSGTTLGAATALKTDADAGYHNLDAVSTGTVIYVAYTRTADQHTNVFSTSDSAAIVTTVTNAEVALDGLHVNVFSGGRVALVYSNNGTVGLKSEVFSSALVSVGTAVVDATLGTGNNRITSFASGTDLRLFWDRFDVSAYNLLTALLTNSPSVSGAGVSVRGLIVGSAPFSFSGDTCIAALFNSTTQPCWFVVSATGVLVAKALASRAGGLPTGKRAAGVLGSGTATVSIPAIERGRLSFSSGIDVTAKGIARVELGDYTTHPRQTVELNGALFIPGGLPATFDGQYLVEQGFPLYPEAINVNDAGGGGALSAGTYSYLAVYEYTDALGVLHQSVPSAPTSIVLVASHKTDVLVPTLRLTRRQGSNPPINIAIYRTQANGSIWRRVSSTSSPLINNTGADTVTFNDNVADTALASGAPVYTQGGELENESAPPCRFACTHQGRLVVGGLENPLELRYSKLPLTGLGTAFSEDLSLLIDDRGGDVTGLASLTGNLLVLKANDVFVVAGEGPNDLGQLNGYSEAQHATSDAGCKAGAAKSIVVTPDGVWMQSAKGLRLFTPGLSIAREEGGMFAGAEVDTLAGTILAGVLDPARSQVRFYTGTNVLVWDSHWRQWSTFTGHSCTDACAWNGYPVHVSSAGVVGVGDSSTTRAGTAIALKVETAWLKFAGLQGFQRIWRMLVLGTFLASSIITFDLGYDYEDYATTAPLTSEDPSSDSILLVRFDEGSGTAVADLGTALLPLVANATATVDTSGKIANARSFTGTGTVTCAGNATAKAGFRSASRTLDMWVYPTATGGRWLEYSGNASFDGSPNSDLLYIGLSSDPGTPGQVFFGWSNTTAGGFTRFSGTALTLNAWTHIRLVVTATSTARLYFNSTQVGGDFTLLPAVGDLTTNGTVYLGSNPIEGAVVGKMDELRFYNTARAATELPAIVNGHIYSTWTVDTSTLGLAANQVMQLRHHLATQKCEALRVRMTESGGSGAGFSLTSLAFEVGLKKGGRKLAATKTVG